MKRLFDPHLHIARLRSFRPSKRLLVIAGSLAVLVLCRGVYAYHGYRIRQSVSGVPTNAQTVGADTKAAGAEVNPVDAVSTNPNPAGTPPPMNHPGNKYVDENSAGQEKLTYNEKRSLIISPASLTVYTTSGATVPNDAIGLVYPHFQVSSDDGQPIGYIQPTEIGGVFFSYSSGASYPTGPEYYASWHMGADGQRATPGNYTLTLTAWSPDRQINYTGTMQLNVVALPPTP